MKTMNEEKVLIKGYQPVDRLNNGYQPAASVQNIKGANTPVATPVAMVNITPPKGGTGEVKKK